MKNVLQFPSSRSKRAQALQRKDAQRFFLGMSLFSLTLVAVFAHEQILRSERPVYVVSSSEFNPGSASQFERAIASVQPVNVFRDLEWEHELAKKLGSGNEAGRRPAAVAHRVTPMDDLKYGPLAGKYVLRAPAAEAAGKVAEIEYVPSEEVTDKPVVLPDVRSFLMKYRSLMYVQYANAELSYQSSKEEIWQLFDQGQKLVGRAKISLDDRGQLLGMKIETL